MNKPNLKEHQEVVAAKDMLMRAGFNDILVIAVSPTSENIYMSANGDPTLIGQAIANGELKMTGDLPKKKSME